MHHPSDYCQNQKSTQILELPKNSTFQSVLTGKITESLQKLDFQIFSRTTTKRFSQTLSVFCGVSGKQPEVERVYHTRLGVHCSIESIIWLHQQGMDAATHTELKGLITEVSHIHPEAEKAQHTRLRVPLTLRLQMGQTRVYAGATVQFNYKYI